MSEPIRILMADDDPDDRLLLRDAMEDARLDNPVDFAVDGRDLMDRLLCKGAYAGDEREPLPDMILLDLNMPRMDGRECIAAIRAHPELNHLPIIVLTTSRAEEDVIRTYQLGVNSFITKPVTFDKLVRVVQSLSQYWFRIVRLPRG